MKPLIWKELRENVRWLPVAMGSVAIAAFIVAPTRLEVQTLVAADLLKLLSLLLPLLAFGLGVIQSYRDLQSPAADYLGHRSTSRGEIFLAKTIVGFAVYAVAVLAPLLLMAVWLGARGPVVHPMRPAQVLPSLAYALAAFAMHPAAMMMMVRDARWWGTRLFPLVPAGMILVPLSLVLRELGLIGAAYGTLASLIALAWLVLVTAWSWRQLAGDPPAARRVWTRRWWLLPAYLTVSSFLVVCAAAAVGLAVIADLRTWDSTAIPSYPRLGVDDQTGEPWFLVFEQRFGEHGWLDPVPVLGQRIEHGETIESLVPAVAADRYSSFASLLPLDQSRGQHDGFFSTLTSLGAQSLYAYDHRGYVLRYSRWPNQIWTRTVAADGTYPPGELIGAPFTMDPIASGAAVFSPLATAGFETPWIDSHGVYLYDVQNSTIRTIIDLPIWAAAMYERDDDAPPTLLLASGGQLLEYRLVDAEGSDRWFTRNPSGLVAQEQRVIGGAGLRAERIDSVALPTPLVDADGFAAARAGNGWLMSGSSRFGPIYRISAEGEFQRMDYAVAPGIRALESPDGVDPETVVAGIFPTLAWAFGVAVKELESRATGGSGNREWIETHPLQFRTVMVALLVVLLVSWGTAWVAARRRDLSRAQTVLWLMAAVPLGLAAPLAVLAIYQGTFRESCPRCNRPRRVDQEACPECGADWEPPPSAGIEIITRNAPSVAAVTFAAEP